VRCAGWADVLDVRRLTRSAWGGRASTAMARLNARHPWSHHDHFHGWLLRRLPAARRTAVDLGCGEGALAAALAGRFERVWAVDVDAAMRAATARRCAGSPSVRVADAWPDGLAPDLVTMVSVLHHLDARTALERVARELAPRGRFLCVGHARLASAADTAWDLVSVVTNPLIGLAKHPRPASTPPGPPPFPVREPELSLEQVRAIVHDVMPGAVVRRRVGFRHTIAWTKPPGLVIR